MKKITMFAATVVSVFAISVEVSACVRYANCNATVRENPSICSASIGCLCTGEDVEVIDIVEDLDGTEWCQLEEGGFVRADLLETSRDWEPIDEDSDWEPIDEDDYEDGDDGWVSIEKNAEVETYKTVAVSANVRSCPSKNSPVVNGVSAGETVGIYCERDGWYYTDRGGYIAASLFEDGCSEWKPIDEYSDWEPINEDADWEPIDEGESSSCDYTDAVVISIAEQMIYVYKNGVCICSDSCVTGKNSTPTPRGEFEIEDKELCRTLTGKDYEVEVQFWMPFYDGCGMHDASWREVFGGDIYEENGSHGCVNLDYSTAETIYYNCSVGTPVIVK